MRPGRIGVGSIRRVHISILSIILILISVTVIMFIVLDPYEFSPQAFLGKPGKRLNLIFTGIGKSNLSDSLLNMLLFLPLGFFFTLFGVSRRWSFLNISVWTGTICLILSYWVEFMQLFLPGRSPAILDVLSNTFGGLIGFFLFYLLYQEGKQAT